LEQAFFFVQHGEGRNGKRFDRVWHDKSMITLTRGL
jgi:hypothetical protein